MERGVDGKVTATVIIKLGAAMRRDWIHVRKMTPRGCKKESVMDGGCMSAEKLKKCLTTRAYEQHRLLVLLRSVKSRTMRETNVKHLKYRAPIGRRLTMPAKKTHT